MLTIVPWHVFLDNKESDCGDSVHSFNIPHRSTCHADNVKYCAGQCSERRMNVIPDVLKGQLLEGG